MTTEMTKNTTMFEKGKIYCIDLTNVDNTNYKRIVSFEGENTPWKDFLSGEMAFIDPECISKAIEVPEYIIDAIKIFHEKKSIPQDSPKPDFLEEEPYDAWERDVYCDEWDA